MWLVGESHLINFWAIWSVGWKEAYVAAKHNVCLARRTHNYGCLYSMLAELCHYYYADRKSSHIRRCAATGHAALNLSSLRLWRSPTAPQSHLGQVEQMRTTSEVKYLVQGYNMFPQPGLKPTTSRSWISLGHYVLMKSRGNMVQLTVFVFVFVLLV